MKRNMYLYNGANIYKNIEIEITYLILHKCFPVTPHSLDQCDKMKWKWGEGF